MEEINIKELLEYFKSKVGLLLIITVIVCIAGCLYGIFLQKPMYSSYTTVILSGNNSSNSSSITQSDITLNKNLVNTYAEIVKSRRVLEKVISRLSLDTSYSELSSKITVGAVTNTEIIKIIVNDDNATDAKNIANVTANYFSEEVKDLYNMNNVNILDEAIEANNPYNINIPKQLILYFMFGLVAAFGIIFVIFYFDRTVKSVEQVEQKIKLPILGSVQEFEGKRGK